jgi:hypothetical protein
MFISLFDKTIYYLFLLSYNTNLTLRGINLMHKKIRKIISKLTYNFLLLTHNMGYIF